MPKVTAINEYGKGRYIVHFEGTIPCLCSTPKFSRIWNFDKKPTEQEVLDRLDRENADET